MLQHLHENGLIPHSPSRTDEEYCLLILGNWYRLIKVGKSYGVRL
jgi:hypothetical protein